MTVTLPPSYYELAFRKDRQQCERSLYTYFQRAWRHFEAAPLRTNWHLGAIAEHLEAVSYGQIRNLIINEPPRTGKTSMIAICWPTWTWANPKRPGYPLLGPQVTFLCASYGAKKAQEDGVTARRLIGTEWYQQRWGQRVRIQGDRDNQERYDTQAGGSRINTGIPESLGKGGLVRLLDDPHKTSEVESELQREAVIRAYREVWETRSNDAESGAQVLIMQRLAANDLTGYKLDHEDDVVHLMLPMEYEPARSIETVVLPSTAPERWSDPREEDGELLWPEKFPDEWCRKEARSVGPFAWAAQYAQRPAPRGGGIVDRAMWRVWPAPGYEPRPGEPLMFPPCSTVWIAVDTAVGEKEGNSFTACTAWGVWADQRERPQVVLLEAWRDRLPLLAPRMERDSATDPRERSRRGIVERVLETARKRHADLVLIEDKTRGRDVANELRRLIERGEMALHLFNPQGRGDKAARLQAVQPLFADGMIWAPELPWADMVIDEVEAVPKGATNDLADTVSMALLEMRDRGILRISEEADEDWLRANSHVPRRHAIYDV